jgi:hypothetical protein
VGSHWKQIARTISSSPGIRKQIPTRNRNREKFLSQSQTRGLGNYSKQRAMRKIFYPRGTFLNKPGTLTQFQRI